MSRVIKIDKDMDAASMADMRETLDELAEAQENVEINMKGVEFIDSSGVGGLVFLYKRLLSSGYKLTLHNITGQPLRLLMHLRMEGLIAPDQDGAAA